MAKPRGRGAGRVVMAATGLLVTIGVSGVGCLCRGADDEEVAPWHLEDVRRVNQDRDAGLVAVPLRDAELGDVRVVLDEAERGQAVLKRLGEVGAVRFRDLRE